MPIKVYSTEQSEQWDIIVHSFREYDVYYLSGYVKAFQINGDGEALLLYYDSDEIRGMNVVMKRDIAMDTRFNGIIEKNLYYDLVTPYGYGGWLIENKLESKNMLSEKRLFTEYSKWCKDNNIISEFVRFHPVLENQKVMLDFYDIVPLGNTIAMDLSTPDDIWSNLTSKNRNMIRKAKKSGVRIFNGRYPEIYHKFREIYNLTMDKDNAEEYYYFEDKFYNSILFDLAQNAQVFYAVLKDKVIAASIILNTNKHLNYHLSGSLREYQNLAPTNLLLFEVALWGYENGCKTFHLGGGVGASEDSLYKFKKAFYRGEACRFYIGRKVICEEVYEKLVEYREIDSEFEKESKFFPLYRA